MLKLCVGQEKDEIICADGTEERKTSKEYVEHDHEWRDRRRATHDFETEKTRDCAC